jgi:hypothetical protein
VERRQTVYLDWHFSGHGFEYDKAAAGVHGMGFSLTAGAGSGMVAGLQFVLSFAQNVPLKEFDLPSFVDSRHLEGMSVQWLIWA